MVRFGLVALAVLILFIPMVQPQDEAADSSLNSGTLAGMKFRGIGPALMSGRIADIAIHPENRSTWYVAVGSGGVWKTTNAGTTWTPIFDDQASYSVGCVSLDPGNPEVVWAGTGENVSGRHVGYGDGVYKSADGGRSWRNMGLMASEHISRILIDPRDSKVVYVAAEGPLWSAGGERGVYKSVDGGQIWSQVLEISENTGVTDIEFDPRDPDILYAAAYQRRRHIWSLLAGGPESGVYKTQDAGENWARLTQGLPKGDMGKISLAVSPINPDIVYATIEAHEEERGFYRSSDSGESWEKRSNYTSGGTGPHYYQEIYASPHKLDRIYQMDVWINISEDGGNNFQQLGEPYKHSDNHALAFDLDDPRYLLAGSDGGLYESFDEGRTWKYVSNLPVTQFYKMALDNDAPFYNIVGGTQDNGTLWGPSRTGSEHGIQNRDWLVPYGADGYACRIDPKDPNIIYVTWQNGNLLRYDRRSRELVEIKPQPEPDDSPERWNWDAPLLISPHSNTRIFFASQRLWRSDDRGNSWKAISGDLSRGLNRYELKMMGRVWSVDALYDNGAMSWYGNATAISESTLQEGLIYVGTDDGLIQVTEDGGRNWRKIDSFPGVPDRAFVNDIQACRHDPDTLFVLFDNQKVGDFKPYALKSTDRGRSWTSITGDLPERHILWSLDQDHIKGELLFLGSEFGIFFTIDGGSHWIKLQGGAPTISFRDIEIQRRESDLVGASFGRGFFVLDDYAPLRSISEEALEQSAQLFPVRDTLRYVPSVDLGVRGKGYQGGALYTAPNPPYGALITYYLREPTQTARQQRRQREKQVRKEGGDIPFAGWEALKREAREGEPSIILTVSDGDGDVIRRLTGPATAGIHRIAWDLRHPPTTPTQVQEPLTRDPWNVPPAGPLVVPGRYSVQIARLDEAGLHPLSQSQSFEVKDVDNLSLTAPDPSEILGFQKKAAELQRRALGASAQLSDLSRRIPYIKKAVIETPGAALSLLQRARSIEERLADIRDGLAGDRVRPGLNEPSVPSVLARVGQVVGALQETRYGPTATHRRSLEIADRQFGALASSIRRVAADVRRLEEDMEAAGVPWTPGRTLP